MTCRELVEFVHDYLSGELPQAQRAQFEEHLEECPDCVAYLGSYRSAITVGRQALNDATDAVSEMPAGLVQAILDARRRAH